jgi:hypothetical protein
MNLTKVNCGEDKDQSQLWQNNTYIVHMQIMLITYRLNYSFPNLIKSAVRKLPSILIGQSMTGPQKTK